MEVGAISKQHSLKQSFLPSASKVCVTWHWCAGSRVNDYTWNLVRRFKSEHLKDGFEPALIAEGDRRHAELVAQPWVAFDLSEGWRSVKRLRRMDGCSEVNRERVHTSIFYALWKSPSNEKFPPIA